MVAVSEGARTPDDMRVDEIPFLTVYTPTYLRPTHLQRCMRSVASQTLACEHVVVHDKIGIGVSGMYRDIRNHVNMVHGRYVYILADDNILCDDCVVEELRYFAEESEWPPVIIWQGKLPYSEKVFPFPWQQRPVLGQIDLGCFVIEREVWCSHADDWRALYEADFYFIDQLWKEQYRFAWMPRLSYKAMATMMGRPE